MNIIKGILYIFGSGGILLLIFLFIMVKRESNESRLEKCLGKLTNMFCLCRETFPWGGQCVFMDEEENWRCSMCKGIVTAKKSKQEV